MDSTRPLDESPALRAIFGRRSIARLGGDVPSDVLRTLIDAALAAPNHKMTQPWRFTVLQGDARRRLGDLWGRLVAAESGLEPAAAADYGEREAKKPLRAPAIVVVSVTTASDPVRAEEDFAAAAAATQNLLLAAEALGYAGIWRTGAMTQRTEIKTHLGLEPSDRIVAFAYLGRAAGEPPETPKRDRDANVVWLS